MRKHRAIILLIICVLLLSACGQASPKDRKYGDQRDFLPTNEDLIAAGLNFSKSKKLDEYTNKELLKHERYDSLVYEAGRETSWGQSYQINDETIDEKNSFEGHVHCGITSFKTAAGAELAVKQFNDVEINNYIFDYV